MRIPALALVALLAYAGCSGDSQNPLSAKADPSVNITPSPPGGITGWPCPPFDVETTKDKVDDDDGDSLTDCQEEQVGSDPNNEDSDGDGVPDQFEIGDIEDTRDTDLDGILDLNDTDDDNDGVLTIDEVESPGGDPRAYDYPDIDGIPNYLDADEDNDRLFGAEEGDYDGASGPADGDREGDHDLDGLLNWEDPDDDNDTACCGDEDTSGNQRAYDDDTDGDGILDWADLDEDGDGVLTIDEDWDADGGVMDDNLDGDGFNDYQDIDEDGDTLDWSIEDLDADGDPNNDDTDGDGKPDYRDSDDDNDGAISVQEDEEALLPAPTTTEEPEGLGEITDDDTDGDGIPNYLDNNDDGDACLSLSEDANGNNTPVDDDINDNDIPDFIEPEVAECEPGDPETFRLDVNGTGFDVALDGTTVIASVLDDTSTVVSTESAVLDNTGAFALTFPDEIAGGETYSVDLFVDADGDGSCASEDSYRVLDITGTTGTVVADLDATTAAEPAACATFP
jgi:hypothetical protein